MPLRAFLLFGQYDPRRTYDEILVSMPLRAFLLFGPCVKIEKAKKVKDCFNALAGIFAFWTLGRVSFLSESPKVSMPLRAFLLFGRITPAPIALWLPLCFNALAGIFAFWTGCARLRSCYGRTVSMPLRAFLLFGLTSQQAQQPTSQVVCFNALAGIFAFWTVVGARSVAVALPPVSMPLRAFLLFGRSRGRRDRESG